MKQYYDFKIENIKDLSPEELNLRKKNLELFNQIGFPNKNDEDWEKALEYIATTQPNSKLNTKE